MSDFSDPISRVRGRLLAAQVPVTVQRLAVARVMLEKPAHLRVEDVIELAREIYPDISRATVYNTLNLLSEKGLVRELRVDPQKTIYDSRTDPHHHIYYTDTGEISDALPDDIEILGLPNLPAGVELEGVDVFIRVRHSKAAAKKDAPCRRLTTH